MISTIGWGCVEWHHISTEMGMISLAKSISHFYKLCSLNHIRRNRLYYFMYVMYNVKKEQQRPQSYISPQTIFFIYLTTPTASEVLCLSLRSFLFAQKQRKQVILFLFLFVLFFVHHQPWRRKKEKEENYITKLKLSALNLVSLVSTSQLVRCI